MAPNIESDEDISVDGAVAKLIAHECRFPTTRPDDVTNVSASAHAYSASAEPRQGNNIVCYHCGKRGHMKRNCFKWKREQPAMDGHATVSAVHDLGVHKPLDWLIDSGASHHVFLDRQSIIKYKSVSGLTVSCENGQPVPVLGVGSVHVVTEVWGPAHVRVAPRRTVRPPFCVLHHFIVEIGRNWCLPVF